jgi:hypothetical protein
MRLGTYSMVIAGWSLSGNAAAQESCPAALNFYKRPLAGKEAVHLCDAIREKLL